MKKFETVDSGGIVDSGLGLMWSNLEICSYLQLSA
jgi:hypothetical protein